MKKGILSISANKPMNFLLQTVLSDEYNIISIDDVFQGMFELKHREGIDLIILDIDYDIEESWGFIHHIKSSWLFQRPIIALTSDESEITSNKLSRAKVDDYFYKPFSPMELKRTVDELITVQKVSSLQF